MKGTVLQWARAVPSLSTIHRVRRCMRVNGRAGCAKGTGGRGIQLGYLQIVSRAHLSPLLCVCVRCARAFTSLSLSLFAYISSYISTHIHPHTHTHIPIVTCLCVYLYIYLCVHTWLTCYKGSQLPLFFLREHPNSGAKKSGSSMWGHRVGWVPREHGGSGDFGAGPTHRT